MSKVDADARARGAGQGAAPPGAGPPSLAVAGAPRLELPTTRKLTPVKWLAAAGALACVMQAYLFSRWILSGPRPTEKGPDPVPEFMQVAVIAVQIVSPLLLLTCLYFFLIRPWFRDRKLGLTAILVLALPTAWWQDIAFNYFNPALVANAEFINFGSWYDFIPGWVSPNAEHLVEPLLLSGPAFVWAVLPQAVAVAFVMRWANRRWLSIGKFGLFMIAILATAVYDTLLELVFLRLGLYSYVGAIPSLTVFAGDYYQFPLYEAFLFGAQFAAIGALLYFIDDNGDSMAERGIRRIKASPRQKGWLRFFAVSGYVNLTWATYNVLFGLIALLPSFTWAEDVVENRSYLRDELCGAGTTYACPSADVPIPRKDGIHVSPDGKLIVPRGVELPPGASPPQPAGDGP